MRSRTSILIVGSLLVVACGSRGQQWQVVPAPRPTPEETESEESVAPTTESLRPPELVYLPSEGRMVTFRIAFDAGSVDDPVGSEGLTHLTAHLMAEGGAGDLTYREVVETLYPMAAELSVEVGRDQTVFIGRVHRDHLDAFYALLLDVLGRPRMAAEDFSRLKAQTESELLLELRGNDDEELGKEVLQAMLYRNHPYAHPTIGTERGLEQITLEDARNHRLRVFCGGRARVGVAGPIDETFAERVRADVAGLGSEACVGRAMLPEASVPDGRNVWIVDKPEAGSVAISMGFPIAVTRDHPDYPALLLASAYLGQHRQFIGRLMQEMRGVRGLNYGDYAYIEHFEQDDWTRFPRPNTARRQQYFSVWIRPVRPEQAHFAVRMAVRELERFTANGMTKAEFARVRTFVDRYYPLYLQTESRRLGFAIDDAFFGVEQPWLERLRQAWGGMTRADVNAAVRRHFTPDRLQIAVVHPEGKAFAEALASDVPSPIQYATEVPDRVLVEDREIEKHALAIPREHIEVIPVSRVFR